VSARRDEDFTAYVQARLAWLRRVGYLLCQDWQRADDLVQTAITSLYVHWRRARAMDNVDGYARTILVRAFLNEQRGGWARRVTLTGQLPDVPGSAPDTDDAMDVRGALAGLPPRQRATLVLRFYCDLNVDQAARVLGCSAGTVKSQTAKALAGLRRALDPGTAAASGEPSAAGLGARGITAPVSGTAPATGGTGPPGPLPCPDTPGRTWGAATGRTSHE
jgi:RNA polymerase sigma-70 factor (sigma-E family)